MTCFATFLRSLSSSTLDPAGRWHGASRLLPPLSDHAPILSRIPSYSHPPRSLVLVLLLESCRAVPSPREEFKSSRGEHIFHTYSNISSKKVMHENSFCVILPPGNILKPLERWPRTRESLSKIKYILNIKDKSHLNINRRANNDMIEVLEEGSLLPKCYPKQASCLLRKFTEIYWFIFPVFRCILLLLNPVKCTYTNNA